MTRFECPPEYIESIIGIPVVTVGDLPRLCRSEALALIKAAQHWSAFEFNREADKYVKARFGVPEAAPEREPLGSPECCGKPDACTSRVVCVHRRRLGEMGERCEGLQRTGGKTHSHRPDMPCVPSIPTPSAPAERKCGEPSEDEGETRYCRLPYPHTGSHEWAPVARFPQRCEARHPKTGTRCSFGAGHSSHHGNGGSAWLDQPSPCTACGCATCKAERAFVRALAEWHEPRTANQRLSRNKYERLRVAARKVVG